MNEPIECFWCGAVGNNEPSHNEPSDLLADGWVRVSWDGEDGPLCEWLCYECHNEPGESDDDPQ